MELSDEQIEMLARMGLRPGDRIVDDYERINGRWTKVARWIVNNLDGGKRQVWPEIGVSDG